MSDEPAKLKPATALELESVSTATLRPSDSSYVNFCSVTGTPEEMIIDFALEIERPSVAATRTLIAPQRISIGFYTAKRLLEALRATVERHEATFGPVETDVEKRLINPAQFGGS